MNFLRRRFSDLVQKTHGMQHTFSKLKATPEAVERYKKDFYNMINVKKDFEGARSMAQLLLNSFEPSLHLYNIVLKGNIYMNDVDGIKNILALIAQNKFAFNAVTLNLLLVYYRDLNLLEDAERLFQVIEEGDSPMINCPGPNLAAVTTMMTGWQRKGKFEKVKYYFEKLEKYQIRPDEFAYNILLLSALEAKEFQYFDEIVAKLDNLNSFVIQKTILKSLIGRDLDFNAALQKLLSFKNSSLELSELLQWAIKKPEGVAISILEAAVPSQARIGDPKVLHGLMGRLSIDGLLRIGQLSLKYRDELLPITASRLVQACANHSDPRLQDIFNQIRLVLK